ncbi:zinc finger, C6HC-type containing protein [Tanacetum coccineum]
MSFNNDNDLEDIPSDDDYYGGDDMECSDNASDDGSILKLGDEVKVRESIAVGPDMVNVLVGRKEKKKCTKDDAHSPLDCETVDKRVLKWTYAYGYYIPIHEEAKKELFEDLQGQAEIALERLHYCAEWELQTYTEREDKEVATQENLYIFKVKLTQLTNTTQIFFKNLVRALENNLSEVDDDDRLSYQWVFFDT